MCFVQREMAAILEGGADEVEGLLLPGGRGQIAAPEHLEQADQHFWEDVGVARNAGDGARLQSPEEQRIAAARHLELSTLQAEEARQRAEIAGAVLDADHIRAARQHRLGA